MPASDVTRISRRIAAACLLSAVTCPAAELHTGVDAEAHLPYWEVSDRGIALRLVQRLPDQTRAFFSARGFGAAQAERIAQSCVFQTTFHNTSNATESSPTDYDLGEWSIFAGGHKRAMKTREDWAPEWLAAEVPKAARIAFEWSLFPTRQHYNPGDYNWGMSVFDLPPGTHFDLEVVWHQYGAPRRFLIRNIQCSPDVHLSAEDLQ